MKEPCKWLEDFSVTLSEHLVCALIGILMLFGLLVRLCFELIVFIVVACILIALLNN